MCRRFCIGCPAGTGACRGSVFESRPLKTYNDYHGNSKITNLVYNGSVVKGIKLLKIIFFSLDIFGY